MKRFFTGVFIGVVLTIMAGIGFRLWWPRPGPRLAASSGVAVIPGPSPAERRAADVVIRERRTGTLTGKVKLPQTTLAAPLPTPGPSSPPPDGDSAPDDHSTSPQGPPPDIEPGSGVPEDPPPPQAGLAPGTVVIVPVEGEIDATYVDARTGETLGAGNHPVTGETTVEVTEELDLRVTTRFEDEIELAITLPDRRWWVGLAGQISLHEPPRIGVFVDYRRELARLGRVAVVGGGSVEVYPEWADWRKTDLEISIRAGLAW